MKRIITIIIITSLSLLAFGQHPTSFYSDNITDTSATLNWNDNGCSSITLKYRELGGSWSTPISNATAPYLLSGLIPNTTYEWTARCVTTSGWPPSDSLTTAVPCNNNIDQNLKGFNPDPVYAPWVWSIDTLSLTNNSNCDLRVRPEFDIAHDSLGIGTNDFDLQWYNPYIPSWPSIPYYIDAAGHAVGFWSFGGIDTTGTQILQGETQEIIIKLRFRASANYGTYSANWIVQQVNSTGDFIQTIGGGDSTSISLVDCSIFSIDSSYSSNISCFNYNNGSASIASINNGSNEYLYSWNNGDSTNTANNLPPGNYYCIITDKNWQQCTDSIGFTVSEPSALAITENTINVSCYGDSNGVASLIISGGTSPFVESWNGGSQYNLQEGDYSYTVTDANGCTFSDSVHISQPSQLISSISALDITNCGSNDGIIDLSVNGGTGTYSYIWSNNDTTEDLNNLSSGTYSVTITDINNCSTTNNATINNYNSTLTTSLISPTYNGYNIQCFGGNNGTIISTTNGGIGSLTYLWSNGQNTTTITNLTAGPYTLTVTDSLSCSISENITLSEPNELTSTYTQTNASCYAISDGGAIVNFFGGATGSSAGDTNYILGWAGTPQPVYLPYPQTVFNTSLLPAPYNAIPAGVYPYTVTDLNGCIIYDTITITEPDSLYTAYTLTNYNGYNVSCYGGNNATIDIQVNGGTAPFDNYLNNSLQAGLISNNLSAGNYIDSIVDANGCIATNTIILYEPSELITTLNTTDISCNNLCNGEVYSNTSGGVSPYYYLWSNTQITANILNLCPGNYSLTVLDENGCAKNASTSINQPSAITLTVDSINNIDTYGNNDGFIYITINGGNGPLNTSWTSANSYSSTTNDILNLYADIYYLEIIDTNLCSFLDTFELTQPSSLWIDINNTTNPSCYDSCNGSINITAYGGDSTYLYSWTGPNSFASNNKDIYNLCNGEYIITIDDGISDLVDTINIYQPQPITTILSVDSIICYNDTAQAEINVWGGTQPFTYTWSNGDSNYLTLVSSGNHSVTVSDINGCSYSQSFSLSNPDSIFTQTTSINTNCFGGNDGDISINITGGGISPYSFSDNNGVTYQSSNTFTNLLAGNYSFLISDINGCLGSASAEVTEPSAIISTTTVIDASCYAYCDGSVSATTLGGTPPYSYAWASGTNNLCTGFYNVIITDFNGCIVSNSAIVNEPYPLLINIWIDDSSIIATSGFASYQWYDYNNNPIVGANDSIFNPTEMGIYYVTVTDTNGCSEDSYYIDYTISSIENYLSSINIFPNPTNGSITISSKYEIQSIALHNTIGNQLLSVNNNISYQGKTKLDLSTFAKGVYFIKINIDNQIVNYRILLQ